MTKRSDLSGCGSGQLSRHRNGSPRITCNVGARWLNYAVAALCMSQTLLRTPCRLLATLRRHSRQLHNRFAASSATNSASSSGDPRGGPGAAGPATSSVGGGSGDSAVGLPASASCRTTTAAEMVQTRRGALAEVAEECRLEQIVANLQASCSAQPVSAPVSHKCAAVLVPLFEDPASGEVMVVLNQRSAKLNTHSGGWGLGSRGEGCRLSGHCRWSGVGGS